MKMLRGVLILLIAASTLSACATRTISAAKGKLECNMRGQLFCFGISGVYDVAVVGYYGADYRQFIYHHVGANPDVEDAKGSLFSPQDEFIGSITESFQGYKDFYGDYELVSEIIDGESVKTYTTEIDNKIHKIIYRNPDRLGIATLNTLRIIVSKADPEYEQMLLGALQLCAVEGGSQIC